MTPAKTVYGICFAAFIAVIAVAPFTYEIADAKSNNMSVKISPETTRQKKGYGKMDSVKQKQPQKIKKTPNAGGPVAIPYPN